MKAVGVGTPSEMEEADFITDTAHLRLDVVKRIVD